MSSSCRGIMPLHAATFQIFRCMHIQSSSTTSKYVQGNFAVCIRLVHQLATECLECFPTDEEAPSVLSDSLDTHGKTSSRPGASGWPSECLTGPL